MLDGLYESMAWVLAFFYDLVHSYGGAIILLTLAVMAVVTPLTLKGTRSMMAMQAYQPEIRRIQQEFKGDRQKLNEELLKFYRENSINPMGSCLPLLVQAPIFFVLFHVIRGLTRTGETGLFNPRYLDAGSALYRSLSEHREMLFLRFDLSQSALDTLRERSFFAAIPYMLIVAIVALTSWVQQRQVAGRNPGSMTPQQRMLMRIVPVFSLTVAGFPAALGLYWVTSNLCRVATQSYISRRLYGMKNGEAPAVVDADSVEKPAAKAVEKKARTPEKGKPTPGRTTPAGGNAKRRQTGRVTEPKSRPSTTARPPGRPVPGRRGSDSARAAGSRGERPRRRAPNPPASTAAPDVPGDGKAPEPRKKWRR
jgi:YidC/Oxa1 family membrane protein insertase